MKFYVISANNADDEKIKTHLSNLGQVVPSILACAIIVTVGGDGTLLRGAQTAIKCNKPLLGINAGHLGYLCCFDTDTFLRRHSC